MYRKSRKLTYQDRIPNTLQKLPIAVLLNHRLCFTKFVDDVLWNFYGSILGKRLYGPLQIDLDFSDVLL